MTTTQAPPGPGGGAAVTKEQLPYVDARKPRHTGAKLLGILVVWLAAYVVWKGEWTKALGLQDTTALQRKLNEARDWVQLEGAGQLVLRRRPRRHRRRARLGRRCSSRS